MKLAFWSEFGKISQRVQRKENPTDFEYGAQRFGTFLIRITAIMLGAIFLFHVWMREPLFKSRVGKGLCFATVLSIIAEVALPYTPLGALLGLVPLPASLLAALGLVVVCYMLTAEMAKRWFYRNGNGI